MLFSCLRTVTRAYMHTMHFNDTISTKKSLSYTHIPARSTLRLAYAHKETQYTRFPEEFPNLLGNTQSHILFFWAKYIPSWQSALLLLRVQSSGGLLLLEFSLRETALVIIKESIPALCITVRAVVILATSWIIETFYPTVLIPFHKSFCVWWWARPVTVHEPIGFLYVICWCSEPAFSCSVFSAPDPKLARINRMAHLGARLDCRRGELIRGRTIVQETSRNRTVSREIGK